MKKFFCLIFALCVILLPGCGETEKDRTQFSPENEAYEILLDTKVWNVRDTHKYTHQLVLSHGESSVDIIVECYGKSALAGIGVEAGLENFIAYCKSRNGIKEIYASETANPEDFTEVAKKDIKGSVLDSGKRQKIYREIEFGNTESADTWIYEVLYLESGYNYFVIYYGDRTDNFSETQKSANELLAYIRAEQQNGAGALNNG